jgi:hypothetical protein
MGEYTSRPGGRQTMQGIGVLKTCYHYSLNGVTLDGKPLAFCGRMALKSDRLMIPQRPLWRGLRYMAIPIPKRQIDTPLPDQGDFTIADFWSWDYSDVLSNGNRSVFAEYLVATALGVTATPRREWDAVDLRYQGTKIEVKASGYVQSWAPAGQPAKIQFDIARKQPWDGETNTSSTIPIRSADCYVFCLFTDTDRQHAAESVLDARYWEFYVLAASEVERAFGEQKSVRLSRIRAICTDGPVIYQALRQRIDACLKTHEYDG